MQAQRPLGLVVAAAAGVVLGLTFIVFAVVSMAAGHGVFSVQIGILLAAYGALLIAGAVGLWLRRIWARGPVIAFALMAGFGFGEYLLQQPWMWLLVLICLAAVVGVALPSTSRALRERVTPADPPPPPDVPGTLLERPDRSG